MLLFSSIALAGTCPALRDELGRLIVHQQSATEQAAKQTELRVFRQKLIKFLKDEGFEDVIEGERNEYLLHGTTNEMADTLEGTGLAEGKQFFATANPDTARIFSERTLQKAGQKQLTNGYLVLVVPEKTMDRLLKSKLVVRRPVPDLPGHYETVFAPGAVETLEHDGYLVRVPATIFAH